MSDKNSYVPILPYDITYGEHFDLYSNLPYFCELDLTNKEIIRLDSGNIIKYYSCKDTAPQKIGGDHKTA